MSLHPRTLPFFATASNRERVNGAIHDNSVATGIERNDPLPDREVVGIRAQISERNRLVTCVSLVNSPAEIDAGQSHEKSVTSSAAPNIRSTGGQLRPVFHRGGSADAAESSAPAVRKGDVAPAGARGTPDAAPLRETAARDITLRLAALHHRLAAWHCGDPATAAGHLAMAAAVEAVL